MTSGFRFVSQFPISYHLHTCGRAKDLCYFAYEFLFQKCLGTVSQIRRPGEVKVFMQSHKCGDHGISMIKLWALILSSRSFITLKKNAVTKYLNPILVLPK